MTRDTGTKTTTIFIHYKANVIAAAGITEEAARQFSARIHSAYDMGEPVWMIADEIRLRASRPRQTKTPRALAIRYIRVVA